MKKILLVAAAAGITTLAACGTDDPTPAPTNVTIIENGTAVPDERLPGKGGPCGDGTQPNTDERCR